MGGRCARELPQRARREGARLPPGPDALSRVLTRLTSRWPLGGVDQRDFGEAGRVAGAVLRTLGLGYCLRSGSGCGGGGAVPAPAFLQVGARVAVTSRDERLGQNPERFRSSERGWWGKGAYALMGSFQLLSSA